MKLIERYALSTGLKINEPYVYKAFYPIVHDKYITIHASSGMAAKCYSFWEDVVELIKPELDKLGIAMIQLGGADDAPLKHCQHLQGATTVQQTCYILSKSILHLSNDTFSAHVAGAMKVPLVSIYGPTTIANHSPYIIDPSISTLIEADRKGKLPSYSSEEFPKTVDNIRPEEIANAALKLFNAAVTRKSLSFGEFYPEYIIEYVPDHGIAPTNLGDGIINIRMDYHYDEENFVRAVYNRKCNVITDRPVPINLLTGLKKNINLVSMEVKEDTLPEYVAQLKAVGVNLHLFTNETDAQKISDLRLKHFEYDIEQETLITKESLDLKDKVNYNTYYKTNKFVLAKDGLFLSKADWLKRKRIKDFNDNVQEVPDVPEFWHEANYFYIFNKE